MAYTKEQLRDSLDHYLSNPNANAGERHAFIERECTFTDGNTGKRTGEYLLSRMGKRA